MNFARTASALIVAGSVALIFWQAASRPAVAPALQATAKPLSSSAGVPIRTTRIPSVRLLGLLHQGDTSSALLELDAKQVNAEVRSTKPKNQTVAAPLGHGAFEGQPNGLVSDDVARERNQQFIQAMRLRAAEFGAASQ